MEDRRWTMKGRRRVEEEKRNKGIEWRNEKREGGVKEGKKGERLRGRERGRDGGRR